MQQRWLHNGAIKAVLPPLVVDLAMFVLKFAAGWAAICCRAHPKRQPGLVDAPIRECDLTGHLSLDFWLFALCGQFDLAVPKGVTGPGAARHV